MTDYHRELKNNQTIPCMGNCGEWRVLQYPEFISSNRETTFPPTQGRQNNHYYNNNNNKNQTNDHYRRHFDTQDNHFSSDDRSLNDINHQTVQFPYQNQANARYFLNNLSLLI